jgi:hypothetical protein
MRTIRTFLAPLALVTALASTTNVHAQSSDRAAAEALFRAGRDAADAGDHALACRRFAESQRLDPQLGTQFNLGDCNERLGKVATAWQLFSEVLQKLPVGDERIPIARERVQRLEPRLPRLVLRVEAGTPAGTRVLQDEVELRQASFGVALPVDPGQHRIRVIAPGHEVREYSVTTPEGARQELVVTVGPELPEAPPAEPLTTQPVADPIAVTPEPLPVEDRSGRRTAGIVVGGVGIAGLGISMATGAMAIEKKKDMGDGCSADGCTDAGLEAADDGKTIAGISTVSFVVGAAAVGVGTYLIVSSRKKPDRVSRIGVRSTPGGAALVWGGTL